MALITVSNKADGKMCILNTDYVVMIVEWGEGTRVTLASENNRERPELFLMESVHDLQLRLMQG